MWYLKYDRVNAPVIAHGLQSRSRVIQLKFEKSETDVRNRDLIMVQLTVSNEQRAEDFDESGKNDSWVFQTKAEVWRLEYAYLGQRFRCQGWKLSSWWLN